ncbi:MAG: hydrogenase maturation nickel metallochaperone HypA [Acidobacteriia bacterium]|nr:hydrogenase maturation nickel metallochaperone HypA [Terriglobia bacterium]
MHELSIALSIVELAEEEAAERSVRVTAVHLKLGRLSGVVRDALLASYEMAAEGTALAGSRLVIEDIPVLGFCPGCNARRTLEGAVWFVCPVCESPISEIVAGRELEVYALEIRE